MIDDQLIDDYTVDNFEFDSDPLGALLAEGKITEVLGELKSGKEGTAYCCRAHPSLAVEYVAAKVYRPRTMRTFRNDSKYREGRVILNKRDARAVKAGTEWGRGVQAGSWLEHEFETLSVLHDAGADVPRPFARTENVILMEFIGEGPTPAPMLQHVDLELEEARPLFARALSNIELLLRNNQIHGDLSAYNILYHRGALTLIDFPQSADPRANPNALDLLTRDVQNVYRYFSRYGVRMNPQRYAQFLWGQFLRAEL
ncbi:MAG: serine protein kinase RIO [Chloroflexota bacterium]